MRRAGLNCVCCAVLAGLSTATHALDAVRTLRPMVYIDPRAARPSNDDARDRALRPSAATESQTGPNARAQSPPKAGAQLVPGTVVRDTASGKPFVAVGKRANCTVSASAVVSLEDQLRACAGLPSTNARASARSTVPDSTKQGR